MSANFDTLQNFTTELNWTQKDVQPCSDIRFLNIEKTSFTSNNNPALT